jgi:hypothetical protein
MTQLPVPYIGTHLSLREKLEILRVHEAYVNEREKNIAMLAALKAYEAWEAKLVLEANWEACDGLPTITHELYEALMEAQSMRNAAIKKAEATNA